MRGKTVSRESGNAVVELALALPVLIGLFLGTLQFGYSFYVYNELEQAVRAGARYGSMRSYSSTTPMPDTAFLTSVKNAVVYANPSGGTQPVAPGLTTANVAISVTTEHGVPTTITVSITNYRLPQIVGSVLLTNKPSTQFPYLGVYSPPPAS